MTDQPQDLPGVRRLLRTVADLRAPDGCPWDRQQTTASMARHLIEEAFEAADALRRGQREAAQEELGDVLVNVAMIAQIASERPAADSAADNLAGFDLDAIAGGAADKLIRRHPHVFGDEVVDGAAHAFANWERAKRREAGAQPRGALDGVPAALPALLRAFRVGEKAAKTGFDWPDRQGPRDKLDEEIGELDEAIGRGETAAIEHELGDVLFSLCNLARHLGIDPESALRNTTDRFQRRFAAVERELGPDLAAHPLADMEAAWQRAKAVERTVDGPSTE